MGGCKLFGTRVVPADLCRHVGYFFKFLLEGVPKFVGHARRLLQRNPWGRLCLYPDAALVQVRQEILPHRNAHDDYGRQDDAHRGKHHARLLQQRRGEPFVPDCQSLDNLVPEHFSGLAVNGVGKTRNQNQGHAQGTEQGISHGIGHWREKLLLNPLERKKRQISRDDDDGREEDGLCHLLDGRNQCPVFQWNRGILLPQSEDCLHHDDGTVHEDAEIDGTQAEQVGRNSGQIHQDEGEEQGNGDGDGHGQGAERTAQKQQEDSDDEQHAEKQRVLHRVQRGSDQFRPVEEHLDPDTFGENVFVQVIHNLMHFFQHLGRILVAKHLDDPLDPVADGNIVIDIAQDTLSFQVSVFQRSQVPDADGHAAFGFHHDVSHVFQIGDLADAADDVTHVTDSEHAPARIGIVLLQGIADIVEGKVVCCQGDRIDFNLVLGGQAAEIADIGHTLDLFQRRYDRPLVQVCQFPERNGRITHQYIAEYLTGR